MNIEPMEFLLTAFVLRGFTRLVFGLKVIFAAVFLFFVTILRNARLSISQNFNLLTIESVRVCVYMCQCVYACVCACVFYEEKIILFQFSVT